MNILYKKIGFFYIDIGLVITDRYGAASSGLYMVYATANKRIIGYILLSKNPSQLTLNLLELQIFENVKNIKKWMKYPISYNPLFKTSPYIFHTRESYLSIAKSKKHLNMVLKPGSDRFLDMILDIPSEYLSPLLRIWVFTPRLALLLIRDQMHRNCCRTVADV